MTEQSRARNRIGRVIVFAAIGVAGLFLCVSGAEAKWYTRSCQAKYTVIAKSASTGAKLSAASYTFSGQGRVGWFYPNQARERARAAIINCVDQHWAHRTSSSRPAACTEASNIYSYPFTNLMDGFMGGVCQAISGDPLLDVEVRLSITGDTGCTSPPPGTLGDLPPNRNFRARCSDYEVTPFH